MFAKLSAIALFMGVSQLAQAFGEVYPLNALDLRRYKTPVVPELLEGENPIIVDKTAAIQLGKALFWDTNVGSQGVACATCHFHAGADNRATNQLNPGILHLNSPTSTTFETFTGGGVNHHLKPDDFPFFRFENVNDKYSKLVFETDDVVASAGGYKQQFLNINLDESGEDDCTPSTDSIHQIDNNQTRQTTKRNTPTVINAVFNRRNFWDGRANHEFNGVSAFGPRDKTAKIWVMQDGKVTRQKLSLKNASLASQAVAPPTDMIEMSCNGRVFRDIAKKLLPQKPLKNQQIHAEDSVLSTLRDTSGIGLNATYETLVKQAFNSIYWSSPSVVQRFKGKNYSQIEANFSFFFGLAIQLYESTLISDQSKFDFSVAKLTKEQLQQRPVQIPDFTPQEQHGAELFFKSECGACHAGATFSDAVNHEIYSAKRYQYGYFDVNRIGYVPNIKQNDGVSDRVLSVMGDVGFFNTGVVPDGYDVGLGGKDPWGQPLSYSQQYMDSIGIKKKKLLDNFLVLPCNFNIHFDLEFNADELIKDPNPLASDKKLCYPDYAVIPKPFVVLSESVKPHRYNRLPVLGTGAFKIPTLRNVELTGPYMHNGGMKSLEEVVNFYNRGGDFYNDLHAAALVFQQGFTPDDKAALVAFLKTLTDERVRWEKAPFDHPSIKVPYGHSKTAHNGLLEDDYLEIPAIGKNGLPADKGPLLSFDDYLKSEQ